MFNHICNYPVFHYTVAVVVPKVQLFDYYNDPEYDQYDQKI